MKLLVSHPEHLADFNDWLKEHQIYMSQKALAEAKDWSEVVAYRFMVGEYEALRSVVNYPLQEARAMADYEGEDESNGRA